MRARTKRLGVLLGFLALLASTATASADHSSFFEVTNFDPDTTDANADVTVETTTAPDKHAKDIDVHLPPGFLVAHQDPNTSPITPVPDKDEVIGSGSTTARWRALFCAQATIGGTAYMDELDAGSPGNAVARIRIQPSSSFLPNIYAHILLVDDPNDPFFPDEEHYVLQLVDQGGNTCTSFSASTTLTVLGTTASGNKISQNPDTAGDYDVCVEYVDTSNNTHTACDTVTVNNP